MLQLITIRILVDNSAGLHGIAGQDVANTLMILSSGKWHHDRLVSSTLLPYCGF